MSRRRKVQEQDGDRSHIPREERSYVEYHPRLLTHLALTIVRQSTEQPKRPRSNGTIARTNGGRDSISSVSNPPTVNGESLSLSHHNDHESYAPNATAISRDTEEAQRDDLYAVGQITGSHILDQTNDTTYETAGNMFEIDPLLALDGVQTDNVLPLNTAMFIDPILLADGDKIATPSENQNIADNFIRPDDNLLLMSTPLQTQNQTQIIDHSNGVSHTLTTRPANLRGSALASSDRFLRSEVSVEEKYERLTREGGFSIGKLHEPKFRKLDNSVFEHKVKLTSNAIAFGYQADRPYERTKDGYTRTIELPESDLADRVEYDMDEQDDYWLEQYNARRLTRDGDTISREIFEITLTKIEKEWTSLEKRIPKAERKDEAASEDAKCAICDDGECENTNAIVFCDGCNLAVHQECYGVPYIPEGQWLCRKCFASPVDPVTCVFCPSKQGAFKQTSDLHWAHLLCTSWIPEVNVGNYVFMEPVEGVANIPPSRWKLTCYVCKLKVGACIQCSNKTCYTPFHVSCARRARLFLQRDPTNISSVPKSFCDKHVPDWYREVVDVKTSLTEAQSYFASHTNARSQTYTGTDTTSRGQFVVSLKRSKQNAVIPAIVFAEILLYMQKFRIRNKADFIADLCKYWSLKRRSRRGVSLLKRLQLQIEDSASQRTDEKSKAQKLEFARALLVELDEKLRPLLESLMDRESLKKERSEMRNAVIHNLYLPLQPIILGVITSLEHFDSQGMLIHIDISSKLDTDFKSYITWKNIVNKAKTVQYQTTKDLEEDLESMSQGILEAFPEVASREHRFVNKLRDRFAPLLAQARLSEKSRKINDHRFIATCYDSDFEPDGLIITQEKPFNWANRDASPLSDLDDSMVGEFESGWDSGDASNDVASISQPPRNPAVKKPSSRMVKSKSKVIEPRPNTRRTSSRVMPVPAAGEQGHITQTKHIGTDRLYDKVDSESKGMLHDREKSHPQPSPRRISARHSNQVATLQTPVETFSPRMTRRNYKVSPLNTPVETMDFAVETPIRRNPKHIKEPDAAILSSTPTPTSTPRSTRLSRSAAREQAQSTKRKFENDGEEAETPQASETNTSPHKKLRQRK